MIPAMSRIMLAAFLCLAWLAAPAAAAERRYTVTDFDRIEVSGPFVVAVVTGRGSSALASGANGALDRLSIDVQGKTLRVRPNRSAWGGYPGEASGPLKIVLTTQSLRGASVSGSGSLTIDKAKAMRFDAAVSGTGNISLGSVEADMLAVGLLGSGSVKMAGKAKSLRATIQGSGSFDGEALLVEDAQINSDTAGQIGASVRRAATVTSTGTGDTRIFGSPACTVKQLGAGQVFCGKSDQRQR
jgi:hypothetical protein